MSTTVILKLSVSKTPGSSFSFSQPVDKRSKSGVKKIEISDSVIAEFRKKAADPIRDAWIKDMEAQGLPGQELYDLVMKTLAKAKASN